MAKKLSSTISANPLLKKLQSMLPSKPSGPPLPRRELLALLKRIRKALDQMIVKLEKSVKAEGASKRKAPRKRAG